MTCMAVLSLARLALMTFKKSLAMVSVKQLPNFVFDRAPGMSWPHIQRAHHVGAVVVIFAEWDIAGVFYSLGGIQGRSLRNGPHAASNIVVAWYHTHVFPWVARPAWDNDRIEDRLTQASSGWRASFLHVAQIVLVVFSLRLVDMNCCLHSVIQYS